MNKHKFLSVTVSLLILVTACKKTDLEDNTAGETTSATKINKPGFKSYNNWTAQPQETSTVYTNNIEDSSITSSVAANGLVLMFKKTGSEIKALPFEEKTGDHSYFWYYQVSEGSLRINVETFGATKAPVDESFQYQIISAEKIDQLQQKGYSQAELIKLTYETASALLK